jgi:anti-sigma factor RsiW
VTPDQAEALFSVAYDKQLDPDEQRAFDAALEADAALAENYAEFCRTLTTLKSSDAGPVQTPDLLAGVQRKLRIKSGGRFYADRFSERTGWASRQLFGMLLMAALLLALVWLAFGAFSTVQLTP